MNTSLPKYIIKRVRENPNLVSIVINHLYYWKKLDSSREQFTARTRRVMNFLVHANQKTLEEVEEYCKNL